MQTSFWKTTLSGLDFTNIGLDKQIHGSLFIDANLSDSNFEGVDLSHQGVLHRVFKDKAHLENLPHKQMVEALWSAGDFGEAITLIKSYEVRGNDLAVDWILINQFKNANLENTNFKNADLRYAGFYSADLTNADLSGADLRFTFLGNANLSGANLSGANLSGANLSGANLNCKNHPICSSE